MKDCNGANLSPGIRGWGQPTPFWGVNGHFPGYVPRKDFYLVSAASLWSRQRGKFIKRSYPDARTRMFLDSGGFSFFSRQGDYPFSPSDYLRLVEHPYYGYQPLLWAGLDYPCEAGVERGNCLGLENNQERMEATLEHLEYLTRVHRWPGLVPVIQGYSIEERLWCLEEMALRGLGARLMAIGSLCCIKSERLIDNIVTVLGLAAREMFHFPVLFHLFGVKLGYLSGHRQGLGFVFSFDTAAWELGQRGETRNAKGPGEEERRFWRYRSLVSTALARPRQLSLADLVDRGLAV